jgi:flagellum-specific peptidoglycan hydrolase FlgJ
MATEIQKKKFISQISPLAQKAYKTYGKPLPSICIAMAAVESAWGTAGSCKYYSYLGQKVGTGKTATKYWSGKSFNSKTQEVTNQSTGQLVTIKSNFRAYESMEQCVFNYYELLNTSLYKKVLSTSGYKEQMQQIKTCGYMTSVTEVDTCITIISQYNLTQYDGTRQTEEITSDSNPYKEPIANVQRGTKGESAKWVQWHLCRLGILDKDGIDGIIGNKSVTAIMTAQQRLGIDADGIVGKQTRTALKNAL